MRNRTRKLTLGALLMTALLITQTVHAFYIPSSQRWVTRDPINEAGWRLLSAHRETIRLRDVHEANLYRFVGNDPMNEIDPDGRQGIIPWILRCLKASESSVAGKVPEKCRLLTEDTYFSPSGKPVRKACHYECTGGGYSDEITQFRKRPVTVDVAPSQPCPDLTPKSK